MRRLLLAAASTAAVCLLPPFTAAAARPLSTAIVDPWTLNVSAPEPAFERVAGVGATYVKIYVNWAEVAPVSRPANPADHTAGYQWHVTDRQVIAAAAAGLEPFLYMAAAPLWAQQGTNVHSPFRPSAAELGAFATALATRYNGGVDPDGDGTPLPAVRFFQVWNEPNYPAYLNPQYSGGRLVSASLYKEMVNHVTAAVDGVSARNVVIAGATGPHGRRDRPAPLAFMRKMLCLRKNLSVISSCPPARFDVWAHHPYTSGGPTRHAFASDDVSLGDLTEMRRVLMAAVRGGKIRNPLPGNTRKRNVGFWVTEFSWDTKPQDPEGVPASLHARWVSEALYRMWQARVSLVTWFKLEDEPMNAPTPDCFYQSGFFSASGGAKPSLKAFRFPFVAFASRRRDRVSLWGRTAEGTAARVVIERKTRRGWRGVATVRANNVGIFGKTLRRSWKTGSLRARAAGEYSRPFSLRRPRDRSVYPFGMRSCS